MTSNISSSCDLAMPIFCRRLAESDITVTPSVTCMNWLCWWYNQAGHLVSSPTAMVLSEKRKSTLPSGIKVKTWQKTIGIKGKLDIKGWLEKVEWIVDICHNVRLAHSSTYMICDSQVVTELEKVLSVWITLNANNLTQAVTACEARLWQSCQNVV